jgi:hypothetical protein
MQLICVGVLLNLKTVKIGLLEYTYQQTVNMKGVYSQFIKYQYFVNLKMLV